MNRGAGLTRSVEESVVLALFDVANQLYKLGDQVAAGAGLTTQQWLLLLQVAGDPNFARPARDGAGTDDTVGSGIARARAVSRANVSTLVSQLIAKGYVRQREHPGDRRRKQLLLTAQGQRALAEIEPARREANRKLLGGLPPAERAQLLKSLRACLEHLWVTAESGGVPPART
jgi:DNA-binding MarR family transcriptional regulator